MKSLQTNLAWSALIVLMSLSLACQRAPEPAASTAEPAPTAAAAPAQPAASAPAAKPAAVKPAAPKTDIASAAPAAAPAPAAPRTVTLEAGTVLKVRTTNTLSTKLQKTGDTFEVSLAEPLMANGKEIVARNTMLMGRIVDSDPGGRVKGVAAMSVELNHLHTADGKMLEISTSSIAVEAQSSVKKDAVKVGVGAALGTAIGAIAGGKKGAGIGAATGAGAGTAVVLGTRGDAAEIASETLLDFTLRSPLTLPAN